MDPFKATLNPKWDSNMFSYLSGARIRISSVRKDDQLNYYYLTRKNSCRLRKKNPFFENEDSLNYAFQPVMAESGYVNNKFVL